MNGSFEVVGTELQARLIPLGRVRHDVWLDQLTWGALDANEYMPAGSTLRLKSERDGEPYYFGAARMALRWTVVPR